MATDAEIIDYVRAQEKQSQRSQTLLSLYDDPGRNPEDETFMRVLLAEEHARESVRTHREAASKAMASVIGKRRRDRTKTLIEKGGLMIVAGVEDSSEGLLVGALMQIKSASPEIRDAWEKAGVARLVARKEEKRRSTATRPTSVETME